MDGVDETAELHTLVGVTESHPLNDLAGLSRVNLQQRLLNMMTGRGAYPDPLAFQVTTAARLLDKALYAWDSAREKLRGHISGAPPRPTPLQRGAMSGDEEWPRRPSQELFRAIDCFEDVVDSLARLLRLLKAIEADQRVQQVCAPSASSLGSRNDIRIFRNRIAHGDEDLADGKAGKGLSTATLAVDLAGIEIQGVRLEYAELEAVLTEAHHYLQRVIAP